MTRMGAKGEFWWSGLGEEGGVVGGGKREETVVVAGL